MSLEPTCEITAADVQLGNLRIHVAEPTSGSRGAILLYPTVMGLEDPTRAYAAEFAATGVTVVVWDPYNGVDPVDDTKEMVKRSKECEDRAALADLGVILDHICGEMGYTKVAALGWCFGGRIALLHAGLDDRFLFVSAHNPTISSDKTPRWSPNLGRMVTLADEPGHTLDVFDLAGKIACPVQVIHPAQDFVPEAVYAELMESLKARVPPTFYEYYPEAGHGFNFHEGVANADARRVASVTSMALISEAFRSA